MKIQYIKYDNCLVINIDSNYIINDKKSEPSFSSGWVIVRDEIEIKKIQKITPSQSTNFRFELIDELFERADEVPFSIKREENKFLFFDDENDYTYVFREEYKHLSSLYRIVYDTTEQGVEDIEFEAELLACVNSNFSKTEFNIEYFEDYKFKNFNSGFIKTAIVPSTIFPAVMKEELPCSIDGNVMYTILRAYIKRYIDVRYAHISSDYDFCFGVDKKIQLFDVEQYVVDIGSKKKPKYETRYRTDRKTICFEMTPPSCKYEKYTVMEGVEGCNYEDLKKNILEKCEKIIKIINEPLCDCPVCKGRGVVPENVFNTYKERAKL
jgi:hypothetical protein